jgi:hypothetical protein
MSVGAAPGSVSPAGTFSFSAQAPKVNASPNTSEKAVNFRVMIVPPGISQMFYTESRRLNPFSE